jgi:hypothetical protein
MKAKTPKNEYAIIDNCVVNQDCEVICRMGCEIITLEAPSYIEIEAELKKRIPGCRLKGTTGNASLPATILIPGLEYGIVLDYEEYPIRGDYENGWEVSVSIEY